MCKTFSIIIEVSVNEKKFKQQGKDCKTYLTSSAKDIKKGVAKPYLLLCGQFIYG